MGLSLTIFTILFDILGIASDADKKWGKITLCNYYLRKIQCPGNCVLQYP
ncbi:MAG: hypothetical protein ACTSYZ_06375 [Candidatus Helarchaeota archaeon]